MSSSDQSNPSRKGKGKGRQKVNLAKIGNENNRQVTFSKRRAGLFKKASELSTLCGAETAIVVFSPGNKAYSFGHPNVDAIANRFLGDNDYPSSDSDQLIEAHRNANINQHISELTQVESQLELERKRGQQLDQQLMAAQKQMLNGLDYQQLGQMREALLNLKNNLGTKIQSPSSFNTQRDPRANPNLGREEIFQWQRPTVPTYGIPFNSNVPAPNHGMGYDTKGNIFKGKAPMFPNQPSGSVLFDGGAGSRNALLQTVERAKDLEVRDLHEAMASGSDFTSAYNLMDGSSDIIIPYCSDASTPTTDPQSVDSSSKNHYIWDQME